MCAISVIRFEEVTLFDRKSCTCTFPVGGVQCKFHRSSILAYVRHILLIFNEANFFVPKCMYQIIIRPHKLEC